jgi:hypothetical protein
MFCNSLRLNEDLGGFVSTIYSKAFQAQKVQPRKIAEAMSDLITELGENYGLNGEVVEAVQWFLLALSAAMLKQPQTVLSPPKRIPRSRQKAQDTDFGSAPLPISLALIRLETFYQTHDDPVAYETHVKAEAAIAAALVLSLKRCCPQEDIFVATPHRIQRQSVKAALLEATRNSKLVTAMSDTSIADAANGHGDKSDDPEGTVTVDTIERLQGLSSSLNSNFISNPSQARKLPL